MNKTAQQDGKGASTPVVRSSSPYPPILLSPYPPRPAEICAQLLQAMDAAEGRRKRRKRNTTPDALGMEIKRGLLEGAIAADPEPDDFEAWLFVQVQGAGARTGAARAMALELRDDWQFALASSGFRDWLAAGAPSEDRRPGADMGLDPRGVGG